MAGSIIFFRSSGVGGIVLNVRISGPVKTFPHITKSAKNAPTPAISPATIQFIACPSRKSYFLRRPGTPISVMAARSSTSSKSLPLRMPFSITSWRTVIFFATASLASLAASA